MIQRIQSVYLLLTTILAVLFLTGELIDFQNGHMLIFNGIEPEVQVAGFDNNRVLPLTIISLVIPLVAFSIIFLYKNRSLQMRMTALLTLLIILQVAAVIWYTIGVADIFNTRPVPGIRMILSLLMFVFSILAYRGIRKDEKIVRSYDRLR
jgi:magnesium-transporting ATPase (P-type)